MPLITAPVNIIDTNDIAVAVLSHRGDPQTINDTIRTFVAWRKLHQLSPASHATFNLFYSNPQTTLPADYRLDLCVATTQPISGNDIGIFARTIPGGRCAVLRHIGSDTRLPAAISYLCHEWLPQSSETLRDFPVYCQRVSFPPQVTANEAVTDIFLPLVSR